MCGFIGIFGENIDKNSLKKSALTLQHRGPDDFGFYYDKQIGMAHRRLSIIDLSKNAKQPLSNENEDIWLTYNGEIYNFKEMRIELEQKGHIFKSESDSEVIVHSYEEWGENCVKKFNGMFAFAIWDSRKKILFLARDRMGIKPLYYYKDKEKFLFASEIKALFELDVKKELNKEILYDYLNYSILIGEDTLFKNIYSFPPGHYAIIKRDKILMKKFWEQNFSCTNKSLGEATEELKNLLESSIKNQLISDVPVGAFFSGGLDSSTIVSIASKYYDDTLKTFTAGFDVYPEEINNAEKISSEIGTKQYSIELNSEMFIKELPKLIHSYDSPISFASSVPLYFVSKLAKEKVKVVLTGEGSDELFAGYRRYSLIKKATKIRENFGFLLGNKMLSSFFEKYIKDPRYIKILNISFNKINYDYLTGINCLIGKQRDELVKFPKTDILNEKVKELFDKQTGIINKLLYLDQKSYLVELLMKQDKMSMAASIESRVPFLDNEIIGFSNSLPQNFKLNGRVGKYILKKAVRKIIPDNIINKKKIGFTVPLNSWFKKDLKGYIKDQILDKELYGLFDKKVLEKIINLNKSKNVSLQLWALLNFKIWYNQNFKNEKYII